MRTVPGVGSDITLLRPIVHLTEEELSFRGRKRKSAQNEKRSVRFGTMSKPNEAIFFTSYFGMSPASPVLHFYLCNLLCQGGKGCAPRTGAALIFRDEIASSIPSSKRSSKRSSIRLPKFRSPNLRADFFIGVGVRALMRWRATNARWEYFVSWRKR